MDKFNSKLLTVSFAAGSALISLTLSLLIKAFSGVFGAIARLASEDWFHHGVPVAVGLVTFCILQFNPKVLAWGDEVVTEIRKVVWPSRRDTTAMTMAVCVMVLISGAVIMSFDFVSAYVLNTIMK